MSINKVGHGGEENTMQTDIDSLITCNMDTKGNQTKHFSVLLPLLEFMYTYYMTIYGQI